MTRKELDATLIKGIHLVGFLQESGPAEELAISVYREVASEICCGLHSFGFEGDGELRESFGINEQPVYLLYRDGLFLRKIRGLHRKERLIQVIRETLINADLPRGEIRVPQFSRILNRVA